jgi:hypothetical protein
MQVKKITNHSDLELYAPLEEILNKLYLKIPRLHFESRDAGYMDSSSNKVICGVMVFNGNERVGEMNVEWTSHRGSDRCNVYTIHSPRIKNRISPRNAKVTKIPAESLKMAVKIFSMTSSTNEVITHVKHKMASEISSVHYNATRNAERLGEDHLLQLMKFVMEASKGDMPTMNASLDKMVKKPNLDKMMNTARIALSVNSDYLKGDGIVVREERDGSLTSIELDSTKFEDMRVRNVKDTYDLPELYQTKLAMLRILEHSQPVESIGVKFLIENTNWYYLTGGEIITTS